MKKLLLILLLIIPFTVHADGVVVNVFYGDECPHCAVQEKYLKVLESELGENIDVQRYEVWSNKENYELLSQVREFLNNKGDGVPFTVIGNKTFSGQSEQIIKDIKSAILDDLKQSKVNVVKMIALGDENVDDDLTLHFGLLGSVDVTKANPFITVISEAISDAINLGSLWIILFLFSILMNVYNKKKRWILGSVFILVSTITYMIFSLLGVDFTITQTAFIRSFVAIISIAVAAISIDAHMKINMPQKSFLQVMQEKFGKRDMTIYILAIILSAVICCFTLVNQANSSPLLVKLFLEIKEITGFWYAFYIGLYFAIYLIISFILLFVINTIIKELFVENTIGTYNRLIAGIIMLVAVVLLIFFPSIFMMVSP